MPTIQATVYIEAPPMQVFELLSDLRAYNQWLPSSQSFNRLDHISDIKPRLGTVYSDIGINNRMIGKITIFSPPYQLAFQQSSAINLFLPVGSIAMSIHYVLREEDSGTRVNRSQDVKLRGLLTLFESRIAKLIQKENIRILEAAQRYLEGEML
jgi:carbon monoxide dehydrogenase subunit G